MSNKSNLSFPTSDKVDFYSEADMIIDMCKEDIETLYAKIDLKFEIKGLRKEE